MSNNNLGNNKVNDHVMKVVSSVLDIVRDLRGILAGEKYANFP